nr:MAG TPA: hypothetical protein [Caudoviricetes sp.]
MAPRQFISYIVLTTHNMTATIITYFLHKREDSI